MINICVVGRRISQILKAQKPETTAITFFEVKELYNLAYEEKAQARNALRRYRRIARRAEAMDEAYRAQLGLARRIA